MEQDKKQKKDHGIDRHYILSVLKGVSFVCVILATIALWERLWPVSQPGPSNSQQMNQEVSVQESNSPPAQEEPVSQPTPSNSQPVKQEVSVKESKAPPAQEEEVTALRKKLDAAEGELALLRKQSEKEQKKLLNSVYNTMRDYQVWTANRLGKKNFVFRDLPYGPEMMVVPAINLNPEPYFHEDPGPDEEKPGTEREVTKPIAVGVTPLTQAEWARCEKSGACPPRKDAAEADSEDGFIKWFGADEADMYARWLNKEIRRKTGKPGRYRPMTQDEREMLTEMARILKIDEGLNLSGMGWLMGHAKDRLVCDLP
jgi:hypothetical protein